MTGLLTFEGIYIRQLAVADALVRLRGSLPALGSVELPEPAGPGRESPEGVRRATLQIHDAGARITEIVGFPPGAGEPFARELSRGGTTAVAAGVEEGEVWFYAVYRDGELVDRYLSIAEFLEGEEAEAAPRGDPAAVAKVWPADTARLHAIVREPSAHAEASLADFLEALGLPGALEPLPASAPRIHLLVPEIEAPGEAAAANPEDEEEAVRSMLGALGLDDAKAAQYMDVLRSLEKVAGDGGLLEASPEDAERLLMESPELRGVASRVSAMRRELMEAFERTVEAAGTNDPELKRVLARADRAARIEADLADNMRRFASQPKEAMRKNGELLRELLAASIAVDLGRDADAARELDRHIARFREAEPALARDLSRALPLLATHFVADALLSTGGVDLLRQPRSGAIKLRRGKSEGDPAAWIASALARRSPVPLRESVDGFLAEP